MRRGEGYTPPTYDQLGNSVRAEAEIDTFMWYATESFDSVRIDGCLSRCKDVRVKCIRHGVILSGGVPNCCCFIASFKALSWAWSGAVGI